MSDYSSPIPEADLDEMTFEELKASADQKLREAEKIADTFMARGAIDLDACLAEIPDPFVRYAAKRLYKSKRRAAT